MTMVGAARASSYSGDENNIRQSGHRAAHSTAVMALLSMAAAETGSGPDGNVDMQEAKAILSRLARGSAAMTKIRAIESLTKIERDERELRLRETETQTDVHAELREIEKISSDLAEAYAREKGISWPN